jgi:glutathione synthase
MGGYRVLFLIDHASHNFTNSTYHLARSFKRHGKVREVYVASRSSPDNQEFFKTCLSFSFSAVPIEDSFSFDPTGEQFGRSGRQVELTGFDLIILRLPHPVNLSFLNFLTRNFPEEWIINRPSAIWQTGGKDFLLQFPEWCPPMLWCRTLEEIRAFHQEFDLVLKPLRNYGGKGILKVEKGQIIGQDGKRWDLERGEEVLEELQGDGYLSMKYLQNVYLGDKRIVVVNGRIMGASLRKPAEGSWLCNVSLGASSEASHPDEREKAIVARVHDAVAHLGIGIFGMDTLVDDQGQRVLSEINTLSVGGVGPMERQYGLPISDYVADELIKYYEQTSK